MSIGNTKDNGNKGNNFPYQHAVLELLGIIATNSGGPSGPDYELITYNYTANKNGIGYSTGDFITRTQVVTLPTGVVILTLWFNQTTGLTIAAPPIADIDPLALATTVTVTNLSATLGQKPMANSLAVTIANDQTPLLISNANLDAPLSTLSKEATQLLIKALLTTIDGDTSNLDVLLSTRASEATLANVLSITAFQARINTLGQKTSANSTPVVLASDQSAIPVSIAAPVAVTQSTSPWVVSTAALPLPAGAATEATLLTRNEEATQLLIKALLTTIDADTSNLDVLLSTRNAEATQLLIKAKTDNLDVLLSTRATEATLATRATEATLATMLTLSGFQARINTLGQKAMAASTPVVIASDQSAIEVKGTAAVGSAPTNPPLSVSGVDVTTGFKQHIPLTPIGGSQAVRTVIAGISRTPSLVSVPANTALSNTTAGVQEVSIIVRAGANAQIGGVAVPNGTSVTYRANPGDTIGSISYQTGAGTTMLISYTT